MPSFERQPTHNFNRINRTQENGDNNQTLGLTISISHVIRVLGCCLCCVLRQTFKTYLGRVHSCVSGISRNLHRLYVHLRCARRRHNTVWRHAPPSSLSSSSRRKRSNLRHTRCWRMQRSLSCHGSDSACYLTHGWRTLQKTYLDGAIPIARRVLFAKSVTHTLCAVASAVDANAPTLVFPMSGIPCGHRYTSYSCACL